MQNFKRILISTVMGTLITTSLPAADCVSAYTGGCGYEECCKAPCITPAIALGAAAAVAVVAVVIQNSKGGHTSHSH